MKNLLLVLVLSFVASFTIAQKNINTNKFRQLKTELASPNTYRTGSGAPGHEYWQQKADYKIKLVLDDKTQKIHGEETITYTNNSPDALQYLWVQLDQNVRAKDSDSYKIRNSRIKDRMGSNTLENIEGNPFDGGFKIEKVTTGGKDLGYTINKTMMRIDIEKPLKSKASISFKIKWWYNVNDGEKMGARSGYEYFPKDGNYLYSIAQFYPRMCQYSDIEGWQNKQFLGRGEFALSFGDYAVDITVPADFIVAATGELSNSNSVLTAEQKARFAKAKTETKEPIVIVTEEEARENEKEGTDEEKTWSFKAKNVRDFAFVASRKLIWDAMAVPQSTKTVMAMSFYPKEGNPLWGKYSTKAVAQTLKTYSRHTFDYPYPVAISTHADFTGMEYPMICFNFGRPDSDGTYSKRIKYGMIGVIIHEVGHNYFPMIVNSDERQWTWMDEGLNTFLQFLTEQDWERNYPSRRGPAYKITNYMKGDKSRISPIMTNSESIHQFGNNAYAKPATALNILRETIMGRELFDHAFKTYSRRWMFKHPSPADFFRSMEDASAIDLDWFWRGWFFTTDHVDIAIDDVKWFRLDTKNPEVEKQLASKRKKDGPQYIGDTRNKTMVKETATERDPSLIDFYNTYDPFAVDALDKAQYEAYYSTLSDHQKKIIDKGSYYYQVDFKNIGGLVMPIILEFQYEDGSKEIRRIPAEIWMKNSENVSKVFVTDKPVSQFVLDPFLETADTETDNNYFPEIHQPSRFELYRSRGRSRENLMQRDKRSKEMEKKVGE